MAEDPVFWDRQIHTPASQHSEPCWLTAVLQSWLLSLSQEYGGKARAQLKLLSIGIIKPQGWRERQGKGYFFLSCQPVLYIHQAMARRKMNKGRYWEFILE